MEFALGAICGAAALFAGLMALGIRNNRKARPAQEAARLASARKDAALIHARSILKTISDRIEIEPMAAKIAIKGEANIKQTLGEPGPLDEIIAKRGKGK